MRRDDIRRWIDLNAGQQRELMRATGITGMPDLGCVDVDLAIGFDGDGRPVVIATAGMTGPRWVWDGSDWASLL